jgi:hypothetical protein
MQIRHFGETRGVLAVTDEAQQMPCTAVLGYTVLCAHDNDSINTAQILVPYKHLTSLPLLVHCGALL